MDKKGDNMGVYKWKKYNLMPKKRKWYQKLGSWLINHHQLVIYGGLTISFIIFLAVSQAQAQADFLLNFGSG
jgi:hypothetical protein